MNIYLVVAEKSHVHSKRTKQINKKNIYAHNIICLSSPFTFTQTLFGREKHLVRFGPKSMLKIGILGL